MRNYSFDLIDKLAKSSHKETCYSAPIIIKDIPEGQSSGILDPRELELAKKTLAERTSRPTTLEAIRESAGYNNEAINDKEVITEIIDLTDNDHRFSVYTNVLKELKDEILPVIIYAHGGSFFTLSAKKTQNFAKSLAEIAKCRVYNVEYGLAPENPFPIGLNQFETTYLFVKEHANELKINPQKIIVMGDSSGGNFASQIANKYYKDIYMQILYYPAVSLNTEEILFEWKIEDYDIDPNYLSYIEPRLNLGRNDGKADPRLVRLILSLYLQHGESSRIRELNSYSLDPHHFPKTLIFTAEYDGLRIQDDYFAKKLYEAGVNVTNIRYRGIHHAFIDKIGYFPQAEDSLDEIAKNI